MNLLEKLGKAVVNFSLSEKYSSVTTSYTDLYFDLVGDIFESLVLSYSYLSSISEFLHEMILSLPPSLFTFSSGVNHLSKLLVTSG